MGKLNCNDFRHFTTPSFTYHHIHLCPEYSWAVDRDFKIGKAFFTCKHKYPTQFVLVLRV